jgi:pyruvate/2-oxoglutarate/acetoin dehydrogenase E1 component
MVYMQHDNGFIFTTEHPERHLTCSEKLTVKAGKAALKEQCITELKALVKPGSTVSTSLKNVSGSSVKREISFYIVDPRDNEITDIDYLVSIITDTRRANNGSLIVTGSARSLGYELVYNLSSLLWPMGTGGYALKHKCV